jgi:hypothetical protein
MGGLRSEAILTSITRDRFRSVARERASRTIGDLRWLPAQAGSIQLDDQRTTWNTGNVSAVLSDGTAVVAGTQTGGVWLINPIPSPSFRGGYPATPLSDRWANSGVSSLAYGPDGTQHVFVGCQKTDSLMLLELQAVTGAVIVRQTDLAIPLPSRTTVYSIVVIENPRRIVIGTEHGVLWSDIPAATIDVDSYDWKAAEGLPKGPAGALARGLGVSIVAGASDPPPDVSFVQKSVSARLFIGDWQEGGLVFAPATVPEVARSSTYDYKVASSHHHRDRVYATAYNDDEEIRCVLRSNDGGRTWTEAAIPQNAGEQGRHNRAIGASPYRADVVALGWQMGTFLSTAGGASWNLLTGTDTDASSLPCRGTAASLHHDVHDLYFPLNSLEADHLLIASDGGLVATHDLGRCFDSEYSRGLAVLQFYGPFEGEAQGAGFKGETLGRASKNGTLTVSSRYPGLLAGGTQDNGNLYLYRDTDAGSTWHKLVGGDGGLTRFVDPLSALLHRWDKAPAVRMTIWNDAEHKFNGAGPVVPKENDAAGLEPEAMEVVVDPAFRRGGQLLYACAGTSNGDVYGLFADADAGNAHFLPIANVGQSVSAISSLTGETILVGCANGAIVAVDSLSGTAAEQPQDDNAPAGRAVSHLEVLSPTLAYALKFGTLLRFNGQRWTTLAANQTWKLFTAERGSGRLFAATADDVFSSADGGLTLSDASAGLPVSPHCTGLRIGDDGDGGRTLYLSTYGRSVWRAPITLPPGKGLDIDLPPLVKDALVGIIQDGGGIVRIGGRLTRIRPRGPSVDLLAAMAILETARTMSPESAREIERTTLEQMARVIRRAIEEIG